MYVITVQTLLKGSFCSQFKGVQTQGSCHDGQICEPLVIERNSQFKKIFFIKFSWNHLNIVNISGGLHL